MAEEQRLNMLRAAAEDLRQWVGFMGERLRTDRTTAFRKKKIEEIVYQICSFKKRRV